VRNDGENWRFACGIGERTRSRRRGGGKVGIPRTFFGRDFHFSTTHGGCPSGRTMPSACRPLTSSWCVKCATPTIIACAWRSRLGTVASSPPPVCSRPPSPPCASGCAAISSRDCAASSSVPVLLITSPARLPPPSNSRSSLCASSCSPSALAVSFASSIFPSAIGLWSASGASPVSSKNGSASISANKTSPTSTPPGASFSRSPPTPRISTTSPATCRSPSPSISRRPHTPTAELAKALTYQLDFNLVRPNSHKQNLSPWQIVEQLQPRWPLQLCLLPPVFLDYYLHDSGGYDVPRHP